MSKEENSKYEYPVVVKTEGIGPSQYGTKGLVGDKLAEVEEKYDLSKGAEGFGTEGGDDADDDDALGLGDEAGSEDATEEV